MSRQQTPDIMADLMSGNIAHIDGEQVNNKAIKLPKNKGIKQDNVMEIIETKEKATFNLSLSTLEALEDAWIKLKRQLKGEQRITKTAIVEMALEICIGELKENMSDSVLYKRLADSGNKN